MQGWHLKLLSYEAQRSWIYFLGVCVEPPPLPKLTCFSFSLLLVMLLMCRGRSLSVCRGCYLACRQRGPTSRLAADPALGRGGAWRGGPGRAGPPGSPRALSAPLVLKRRPARRGPAAVADRSAGGGSCVSRLVLLSLAVRGLAVHVCARGWAYFSACAGGKW